MALRFVLLIAPHLFTTPGWAKIWWQLVTVRFLQGFGMCGRSRRCTLHQSINTEKLIACSLTDLA